MSRRTPPLGATGRYQLKAPFSANLNTIYVNKAVRSFEDIYKLNIDVFDVYYKPLGLTETVFEQDRAEGACIVTLMIKQIGIGGDGSDIIYVPDTYILSYPSMDNIAYNHVVLSATLGAVPDFLNFDNLAEQVSSVISDTVGKTPIVKIHIAPSSDAISPEQHEALEVGRASAITNRTTDHARYLELKGQYNDLLVRYKALETAIVNGQS